MEDLMERIERVAVVDAAGDWEAVANLRAIRSRCADLADEIVRRIMPDLFAEAGQAEGVGA